MFSASAAARNPGPAGGRHPGWGIGLTLSLILALTPAAAPQAALTSLADQPIFTATSVPGNLALALSVEYPTAISVANIGNYAATSEYLGYFDPNKCYDYVYNATTPTSSYFTPASAASSHACSGKWSGNFLNWATMQTIDPFRWALTGGYRSVDTTSTTILEKAWGSSQGSTSNFPDRGTGQGTGHNLSSTLIKSVTPFTSWTGFNSRIWGKGIRMVFSGTGSVSNTSSDWTNSASAAQSGVYQVYVRVKVCDTVAGVEANCVQYGSNYKPEGLMQKYAMKIRYSAFGYVNEADIKRDGGVLRARMKYIGPNQPQPLLPNTINPKYEWDATTGIMTANPDSSDASSSNVTNSGVMNYLNKFGQSSQTYKTYDNVSELYYAVMRYFKNQGNVPEWTANLSTTLYDNFPIITNWEDPILYSCQKNFVLGIGDTNTHADANLPSTSLRTSNEPALPSLVSADSTVNVTSATDNLGQREGIASTVDNHPSWCCNGNTYYIAGLAYDSHTKDMRNDLTGSQTVSTYWLDVVEGQTYRSKNQYYLAAKYGGFNVPAGFSPYTSTTALPDGYWWTTGDMITMSSQNDKRPDNYFLANQADKMVSGLTKAFSSIAAANSAETTAFSVPIPQVSSTNNNSYSSTYYSDTWTSIVQGQTLSFDGSGNPVLTSVWTTEGPYATQLSGTGWDTGRRVVTWNGTAGIPFRATNLTSTQLAALDTNYVTGNDSTGFLNYLRGDRSNERASLTDTSHNYRYRSRLLGDIVGSKLVPVGPPETILTDAGGNLGVQAFQTAKASRTTMVYVGANDGMLHAFNGSLSGANAGQEVFAYVPSALFQGPSSPATPNVDGLAALGNPTFSHHYYVNATPAHGDVDFSKTYLTGSTESANWHTILVGGLGKGGRSFYALDITDPDTITSESIAAGKVLWEFTDSTLGYSYGTPIIAKTAKYGWVVIVTSGYNNADGKGYIYFLNAKTGTLLEKVSTGVGSATTPSGLAQITGFTLDYRDGTIDAVYGGDLLGNLWRFDVTGTTGNYPAPTLIATLTDKYGTPQPITTRPLGEDGTLTVAGVAQQRRYVLVGTGRMLDSSDIASTTENTFYVIAESDINYHNCGSSFYGSSVAPNCTLPANVTYPLTRSKLVALTDFTNGITYDPTHPMGWYVDLGLASNNVAWRISTDPTADASQNVYFATTLPNGDVCNPSGTSRVYGFGIGSGQSLFASSTAAGYVNGIAGIVTDLGVMVVSPQSPTDGPTSQRVIFGTDQGNVGKAIDNLLGTAPNFQLRNWQEVPLTN